MSNKIVVVTGAASGIGQAISLRAARDGYLVVLVDINNCNETAGLILADKGLAVAYDCDLRKGKEVAALFARIENDHGGIGILVNNAGTMGRWPLSLTEVTEQDWYTVFETNVKTMFLCCKYVLPGMRARGSGAIVNIASELAFKSADGCANYCASKGAVVQFTRALAIEEARAGVRINVVCPGPVKTDLLNPTHGDIPLDIDWQSYAQTALKRLGTPSEIAEVVWFVASEKASYMVGSVVMADGGALAL